MADKARKERPSPIHGETTKPRSVPGVQCGMGGHALVPSLFAQVLTCLGSIESLYTALDALRGTRQRLIDSDDPSELLAVLDRRAGIVEELGRADDMFRPLNEAWELVASDATAVDRGAVQARVESISRLASKVAADDEEDNRRVLRRRAAITAELSGLAVSRAATAAYGTAAEASPRFQDREV